MLKSRTSSRRAKLLLAVLVLIVILAVVGVWRLRISYEHDLSPVASQTAPAQYFTVNSGEGLDQIAHGLQNAGLIRSWTAFEWFVRSNQLRSSLQAGTYQLSTSMSTSQIAEKIADGDIAKNLVTIIPGSTLAQIQQVLIKAGYSNSAAAGALNRQNYSNDQALASLPAGRNLEGYLFPDSFEKTTSTPATDIVKLSIDEMGQKLTQQITTGFKKQGLSVYQGVTLASIVEQESGSPGNDATIAQVFLSRLSRGMTLGSDVTARYASKLAGKPFSPSIKSPYNTRVSKGLPPGPIGTVSESSLAAVASPARTSYLYFVTGDNGKTYFSYTQAQHDAQVAQYCTKACN